MRWYWIGFSHTSECADCAANSTRNAMRGRRKGGNGRMCVGRGHNKSAREPWWPLSRPRQPLLVSLGLTGACTTPPPPPPPTTDRTNNHQEPVSFLGPSRKDNLHIVCEVLPGYVLTVLLTHFLTARFFISLSCGTDSLAPREGATNGEGHAARSSGNPRERARPSSCLDAVRSDPVQPRDMFKDALGIQNQLSLKKKIDKVNEPDTL